MRLTIPEGHALRDIAREDAPRAGISPAAYRAAVRAAQPPAGLPRDRQASGSAWRASSSRRPTRSTKPVSATRLVSAAAERVPARRRRRSTSAPAAKKNLTRYDVLIIASMIEREAAYPADRAKIAAVIYNRLNASMPLGIDATIQYARRLVARAQRARPARQGRLQHAHAPRACRRRRSAIPGLASLKAAAHPAKVPYLYYVAIPGDPKRRHHFSRTFADFQHFQQTHPA